MKDNLGSTDLTSRGTPPSVEKPPAQIIHIGDGKTLGAEDDSPRVLNLVK